MPRYREVVNHVAFRTRGSGTSAIIDIFIDERPLRDFARDAELGWAAAEGHPELAGKYDGLPSEVLATDLLVGRPSGIWAVLEAAQSAGRVPLLVCECGEAGCWPLMATLEITNESVVWRNFRQPHRASWDYKKLGPFTFARTQYLAALGRARSARV
jgi:hypothetical protein